jgi:hypothetical protein
VVRREVVDPLDLAEGLLDLEGRLAVFLLV